MISGADRRRAGLMATVGIVALALAAATFLLGVGTVSGQRFGNAVFNARFAVHAQAQQLVGSLLHSLTELSLLGLGLALMAVALLRRRPRLALAAGVVVFGTAILSQVFKYGLPRPDLGVDPPWLAHNTAPSGHASISMALAIAFVLVVPVRWRIPAGIVGYLWASSIAAGTLAAGWHRPVDTYSGELLALAVGAITAAVLVRWRGGTGLAPPALRSVGMGVALACAVATVPVVVFLEFVLGPAGADTSRNGRMAFIGASLITLVAAAIVMTVFVFLLRWVDPDPPRPSGGV